MRRRQAAGTPKRSRHRPLTRHDLLRDEKRVAPAPSYDRGDRLFVIGYPNDYSVGMSNLGFLAVRRMVERTPGWRVERLFASPQPTRGPLETFESGLNPSVANVLAFSLSMLIKKPPLNHTKKGGRFPFDLLSALSPAASCLVDRRRSLP